MLLQALLQTLLVFWMAQETLQGGVKPQSVAYGRMLQARGVGVGVKPGVTGALGALGSRYGSKAMKTGIGRYPGAHLGVGGYRSLGLGGKTGLKQGGYGAQGAYGASLGTGMSMGPGLTNGLGLGYGQAGKRVYGGHGPLPGYGPLGGNGYTGARPGVSAADLGPGVASLGQPARDLTREKSRALGPFYGSRHRTLGPEMPDVRRGSSLDPIVPQLHAGAEVKSLDPVIQPSRLQPKPDYKNKELDLILSQAQGGIHEEPAVPRFLPADKDTSRSLGAAPPQVHRGSALPQFRRAKNCGSASDLSAGSDINRHELLGSETQRTQSSVPEQGARGPRPPLHQSPDGRSNAFSPGDGKGAGNLLSAHGALATDPKGLKMSAAVSVEDGGRSYGRVAPGAGGTQTLSVPSLGDEQEAQHPSQAEHNEKKSLASRFPGQTGRNTASYIGGAGNYPGVGLGTGGYGAGLGQGAYLGGAAGKLAAGAALGQGGYPLGGAGKTNGYGEGAAGHLGTMAGNGFGYGNGYGDGYGAAHGTGGYAGQVQGGYGALGAGMESTGGKYGGGAAQVPYNPVIPAGIEGDGGYPYPAQQLNLAAQGTKAANKYGAAAGYGVQQPGYGAQLGAVQDALGEQTGKYGVNPVLGNGYKG
ncbi:uncharacterized protein ACNS7B_009448 isoform 2-T2 [Menidia menidia]